MKMKRFKTVLSLILAVIMISSVAMMTSCSNITDLFDGGKDKKERKDKDDDEDEDETEETEESEEPTETSEEPVETEPVATPTPTPTPTPEPTPEPVSDIATGDYMIAFMNEEFDKSPMSYYSKNIVLAPEQEDMYPALAKALEKLYTKQSEADAFFDDVRDLDGYDEGSDYVMISDRVFVRRADSILSYINVPEIHQSKGNTYGTVEGTGFVTVNIDAVTGDELGFDDIITDRDLFCQVMEGEYSLVLDSAMIDELIGSYRLGVLLDPEHVTVVFMGDDMIIHYFPVAYGDKNGLIEKKFSASEGSYICQLVGDFDLDQETLFVDLDGDGNFEMTGIEPVMDEYETINAFKITNGNKTFTTSEVWGFYYYTSIAKVDGKYVLLITLSEEDDYEETYSYALSADSVEDTTPSGGKLVGNPIVLPNNSESEWLPGETVVTSSIPVSPEMINVKKRIWILGTRSASYSAAFDDDGSVVAVTDLGQVLYNNVPLEAKKDFELTFVEDYSPAPIAAGTKLWLDYANEVSGELHFHDEEGTLYIAGYDQEVSPHTVNGYDEAEIFGELPYAA